jgi:copper chaperone
MAEPRFTPLPGAVLLGVSGLRGPPDQQAVLAALRARDPAAHVQADWPRGFLAVHSDHPPEALRLAIQDAGFIAARLAHPPSEVTARGVAGAVARLVGWGFAGFVVGALVGGVAGIALIAIDPACGPGDSGGCAMGIPVLAFGAGVLGGGVGMVAALIRGARRR